MEDRSPHPSPPKKHATEEKEESLPPCEAVLPRGVTEEDILPKRYETFTSDNDWVQRVRCSLLGLEAGTTPSRRDIDTSSCFIPRAAASESDLPEVITIIGCLFSGGKASSWSAPGPVHRPGGLGPSVHSQRSAETSSSGTILLSQQRCTKLDSRCAPRVPCGYRQGVPFVELPLS